VIDDLLANAERHAEAFAGALPGAPARRLAVVACMDARFSPTRVLGLEDGDAHVIRNAGGVISDDAIRSLSISQHKLGTEAIVLIHHTDCGLTKFTDAEFKAQLREAAGAEPDWPVHTFADVDENVRASIARIRASPYIPRTETVRGFVLDVETGRLREVR